MPAIALVTGASSGLGREFVRRIDHGEAGPIDEIWVVARRADRLESLVRTCSKTVRPFCLDLTDPMSFDILESALSETPTARVSLLVNNAGAGTFGDLASTPRDELSDMLALLVRAPVELIYRTLPFMREGSRIINIASVAAFIPQPRLAAYSAAKRFMLDISRSLDVELEGVDIHVTAVCPKFMKTEFLDAPGDARAARKMTKIGFERTEEVVRQALRAARAGRGLCIPSLDMKALYAASRVLPYRAAIAVERAIGML
ncbi:SDR family NAD(P)-dependent oxidoreductase [Collinsella tanakaei]|uniref:SDR family NAD(P)-dependent oxidoreductase n=1 Tax=Collinsella tanakaei TaxID=626935 RepID=UPI0025A3DE11|nr:SDR family NAD(P)-dependent oxidoreductase [Collinsella tanakaei]MDM8245336.1 SDR family NAD(P)-dependent oxidoreductase [Collinsella tanakaei]